jgi:isoquinoline 1-oxidoreductase beta subunit
MNSTSTINRRDFIKLSATTGIELVIGFHLPFKSLLAIERIKTPQFLTPNVWLSIDQSGIATVTVSRCEMGQKIWTSLPMIVAEELEADWSRVRVTQGDFNRSAYGSQTTGGSASIRTSYDNLRKAGAVAREMLIAAAAEIWNVPASSCRAENSTVILVSGKKKLDYGELVETASRLKVPGEVPLKDPDNFKIIGKSIKSVDAGTRVDGSAIFGYDFQLPGALIAAVEHCPVFGGKVKQFDDTEAKLVPGVKHVVQIKSGVAVVADNTWASLQGRKALKITWDEGLNANLSSEEISRTIRENSRDRGTVIRDDGEPQKVLTGTENKHEAVYELPYLDHAPMEPLNCTADVRDDSCEIWVSTQRPSRAHRAGMEITGLPAESVKVHIQLIGGAFGRRLYNDYVWDAVEISKILRVPVKVIRTRDEDLQHGFYRPASYHKVRGSLDTKGYPNVWIHRISGSCPYEGLLTMGAAEMPYAIPNVQVDYVTSDITIPVGAWRSVSHTQNAFVNECFIDELAEIAGKDPYRFRRDLLQEHPRLLGVLDLAAEKAGWGKQRNSHYQGIAVHASFHSYAAVVSEVSVDAKGNLNIDKIICAIDCGTIINPDGVKSQMEGGVVLALTATLYGAITFKNGRVQQSNYHNYKLLKMKNMPRIETFIVPSTESPTGVGEVLVPPTPPALINAISAATGKRIRKLPIRTGDYGFSFR